MRPFFQKLADRARLLPPVAAAVVYPCDRDSLQVALSAAFAGYITPILVGPEAVIHRVGAQAGLDLSRYDVRDTPDDPRLAAEHAAALAVDGQAQALIRGSLDFDDLMRTVHGPDATLATERRLSHALFLDLPHFARGLIVTDTLFNLNPTLAAKVDIVHNAVDFAHALGIELPKVAVLSATETVSAALPSTIDAAELKAMGARDSFPGAIIDGPLPFDVAVSPEAARVYGSLSGIAGEADLLLVPNMETGNLLFRALVAIAGASATGLVLGARVPIALTSRVDSMEARVASCVLAQLVATQSMVAVEAT